MGRCIGQAEVGITLNRSATGTLALLGLASSLLQTELPQVTPDTVLVLGVFKGFAHLPSCDAHSNLTFNNVRGTTGRQRYANKTPHSATTAASCLEDICLQQLLL